MWWNVEISSNDDSEVISVEADDKDSAINLAVNLTTMDIDDCDIDCWEVDMPYEVDEF